MLRALATYLLIAVVLTCPYCCLGEAAVACVVPGHGCGCCADQYSAGDEAPDQPSEGDSDCFCQGAIIDAVRLAEFDQELILSADRIGGGAISTVVDAAVDSAALSKPSKPIPPFSSGREICALTCALLL